MLLRRRHELRWFLFDNALEWRITEHRERRFEEAEDRHEENQEIETKGKKPKKAEKRFHAQNSWWL